MKPLVGQVMHKCPNGDLTIWFETAKFGSKYFCNNNETGCVQLGDRVQCEFKNTNSLGTVIRIKKL